ncbi:MAG: c-type cytochrome biogenesis protein CcsB [Desulfobacteraceae bacterium]|nr:c-type cytochrome biogenesis protein CcsB [Desulfobacteraceae bacterium]
MTMPISENTSMLLFFVTILYIGSMAGYILYLFKQKDKIETVALLFLGAGFLFHLISIIIESFSTGTLPAHDMGQNLSIAALALAGVFLFFRYRSKLKILGVFASPLTVFVMTIALIMPASTGKEITAIRSIWLVSHISLIFIGEASLALACGAGILYLIQESGIKGKKTGFFFRRLPSLDLLDYTSYLCIVTGFTMLTFGLVTGFIYAKSAWGSFWSWDPKEIWSIATWLFYAALLHCRLVSGWQGKKSAIMTIIGFAALLFTFLGVNLFIGSHHQVFTN